MAKPAAKYAIFKQEDFNARGRVVTVGYTVYEVATGARVRSYIPTAALAREYRDRMNAEAAKTPKLTPVSVEEAGRLLASVS